MEVAVVAAVAVADIPVVLVDARHGRGVEVVRVDAIHTQFC